MTTKVVFLGGLGEIGRNCFAVECEERVLVIDAGLSFPTDDMLGVDLVLPDFTYLRERSSQVEAIVLTHGHEDHVGALGWLLRDVEAPVWATPLTLGLARRRLDEMGSNARFEALPSPGARTSGPFEVTFVPVSHSIPDATAVAIRTADGRIVYTGDFKLDRSPIDGRHTDMETFRKLGDDGIDLLLSDSTNIENPGHTPSESLVGGRLEEIFRTATRRVIVACFASNLHRVQQVCDAARAAGRRVALVGRSMVANVEVGRELGHLDIADSDLLEIEDVDSHPPSKTAVICTGSQGEPLSALSLIASGEHKRVSIHPRDTVVLSASPIPGNESAVHRIINSLYKEGAEVFHSEEDGVHASGHAARDELAEMLQACRPRHFTPVHGEYRHLALHARLAETKGVPRDRIFLVEDGDVLELDGDIVRRGEPVPAGMVLVDGLGVGDVGPVVLRDRRVLAGDGVIICVVTIDSVSGDVLSGPDLITRGFIYEDQSREWLDEAADRVDAALDAIEAEAATDWGAIKKACRRAIGEFVWASTRRRPMILPIVMEV